MNEEQSTTQRLKRAYIALDSLDQQLKAERYARSEPIAVIGLSCRFPGGANSPAEYWQLLQQGVDAISEVPPDRWAVDDFYNPDRSIQGKINTRCNGFLQGVDAYGFDPQFFGIAPKEAMQLDPQQRLLLEVTWEALEHANIVPDSLFGSATGVFIGISSVDYAVRQLGMLPPQEIGAYVGTGALLSPAAGRLSYVLGLTGPSTIVDTACSSSLLAVHLACQSLRSGESNLVLTGGVNLILAPEVSTYFSTAGMLSSDGRCKTFDESANGYVRSEGCGIVVLKRLSDAIADGDEILSVIHGSAVNQDGPSGGLTVPSGPSQQQVIRQALHNAGLSPNEIDYVEAHGTGTPLGDPIEVGSIGAVFGEQRSKTAPLMVGSVKTNIGHLEAAAGVAGLIKLTLALHNEQIPKHLHLKQPSSRIPWAELPVKIPTEATAWHRNPSKGRFAGISSFGFSGTNAHVVVGEAPVVDTSAVSDDALPAPSHQILTLSAKTPAALAALAGRYHTLLTRQHAPVNLADLCFTANTRRSQFNERVALVADSVEQLQAQLAAISQGNAPEQAYQGSANSHTPEIAFLFTGQGSQYSDMGKALYQSQPVFRAALDQCDEILRPLLPEPLLSVVFPEDPDSETAALINETQYTQPALFALEYALAQLWQSWGVQPAAVMGHSVGEYVAACIAGVFSLADGLKLIAARARLMAALPRNGSMVTVFAPLSAVEKALAGHEQQVSIAAVNTPDSIVISGETAAVQAIVDSFDAQVVKTRPLTVSHAFHSPLMEPMLAEFAEVVASVSLQTPTLPLISNLDGKPVGDAITTPDYWCRHIRQAVQFAPSLHSLREQGINTFLELGPRPALIGMGQQNFSETELTWLSSLRSGYADWQQLLSCAAQLFSLGVSINWSAVAQGQAVRCMRLPTYPFQHKHYCIERPKQLAHQVAQRIHPLIDRRVRLPLLNSTVFETAFDPEQLPILRDHRVYDQIVVSGASHVSLILGAAQLQFGAGACVLKDVFFQNALVVPNDGCTVQLLLEPKDEAKQANAQLISFTHPEQCTTHVTATIIAQHEAPKVAMAFSEAQAAWERCGQALSPEQVYQIQLQRHISLGAHYQWVTGIRRGEGEAVCQMLLPSILPEADRYQLHPGLLDACFGLLAVSVDLEVADTFVPFGIQTLRFYQVPTGEQRLMAYVKVRPESRQDWLAGDIWLFDALTGQLVAEFIGFEGREASRDLFLNNSETAVNDWCYDITWQAKALPALTATDSVNEHWLICADQGGVGSALAQQLRARGAYCTLVQNGADYQNPRLGQYQVNALQPDDFAKLFADLENAPTLTGIVHLWSLDSDVSALAAAQAQSCGSALHLVQTVAAQNWTQAPQLWLVTQGAYADKPALAQWSLLGLSRVIELEHPALNCCSVDLDNTDTARAVTTLVTELLNADAEPQIRWQGQQRLVARFAAQSLPAAELASAPIREDATYLISGGTGALGLVFADWLVEQGAKSLLLLSRSGNAQASVQTAIADLQAKGATVQVLAIDLTDSAVLSQSLDSALADLPALAGIIHAAGALDDALLVNQDWARFEAVLAAKVYGAWHLHQYSEKLPLDFFVLCASAASVLGNAGQGNYAAANHFLAGLAAYRRQLGLTALSIHWGPWQQGMAAQVNAGLQAQGIEPLTAEQGLAALQRLLQQPSMQQVMVMPCQWDRYFQHADAKRALFANFAPAQQTTVAPAAANVSSAQTAANAELLTLLADAPAAQQLSIVQDYVSNVARRIIGIEPSDPLDIEKPLMEIGMDSLMAVDIRNMLGKAINATLPVSLLFNYPTVTELVQHLADEVLKLAPAEVAAEEEGFEFLDDLSEDDLAALIERELNAN